MNKLDLILEEALFEERLPSEDLNKKLIERARVGERVKSRARRAPRMLAACLAACFILIVGALAANQIRYNFKAIDIAFACEYTIFLGDEDKVGWIREVAGDGDTLTIRYSAAELKGEDDGYHKVNIINISGAGGERRFIENGAVALHNEQDVVDAVKVQFWSGVKLEVMDEGPEIVKDYSEPLEIAYITFFLNENNIVEVETVFSREADEAAVLDELDDLVDLGDQIPATSGGTEANKETENETEKDSGKVAEKESGKEPGSTSVDNSVNIKEEPLGSAKNTPFEEVNYTGDPSSALGEWRN